MKIQLTLDIDKLNIPKEDVEASGQMTLAIELSPAELFDCNKHYPEQLRELRNFFNKE